MKIILKKYSLIFISIVFLLLNNTMFFWSRFPFLISIGFALLFMIETILIIILILYQIYLIHDEKLNNKFRIINIIFLSVTLTSSVFFPNIIDFDSKVNGERIFNAYHEGSANCTTSLILRKKHRFTYKAICFGITEANGGYEMVNDTILLKYDNKPKTKYNLIYAVIKRKENKLGKYSEKLLGFRKNDTRALIMKIIQNDLK